jgi:hypothetical protein
LRQPPSPPTGRGAHPAIGGAASHRRRGAERFRLRNKFLFGKLAGLHRPHSHHHPLAHPLIDVGRDRFGRQPFLKEVEKLLLVEILGHTWLSLYPVEGDFKLTTHTAE